MPEKNVFKIDEIPFQEVEWGTSKVIVGPDANGSEHLRAGITEYDPETPHEPHSHPGQEEIIWVLSGEGYTETHGVKMELKPGLVAYIPSGMEHKTAAVGGKMTAIIMKSPVKDSSGITS